MNYNCKSIIAFIILILLHQNNNAQPKWDLVATSPPRSGAYSSLAIGSRAYFWTNHNRVISTADGGNTFQVSQYTPEGNVALGDFTTQGIGFTDSLTGYVSDVAYGQFKTTDGGSTWVQTITPEKMEGWVLLFANESIGWRFAWGGFYKTTDGGDTWQFNLISQWNNGYSVSAFALDEQRVWVTRWVNNNGIYQGTVWRSTNGGTSWSQVIGIPIWNDSTSVRYYGIIFHPNGTGVLVGEMINNLTTNGIAVKTSDFGLTWDTTSFPGEQTQQVLSDGDSTWFIFGFKNNASYCHRSTDNGATWIDSSASFFTASYGYSQGAVYLPKYHSLLVSTYAGIYRSTDAGVSFIRLTGDLDLIITDVTVEKNHIGPGPPIILAYGSDSSMIISDNDGATWMRKTVRSDGRTYKSISRARVAGGVIYAMLNQSALYRSTDMGDTWIKLSMPNLGGQQGLEAYDANTVAVNGFPYMLSTNDGGATWKRPAFPGNCWVNQISITDSVTFDAAGIYTDTSGNRGMFYHTKDAGFTFHIVDLPQGILHSQKVSSTTIFAHAVYEVYKSTDGGSSWKSIRKSNDYFQHFTNFYFRDSLYGLLKESFTFLLTTDGGKSWNQSNFFAPFGNGPDAMVQTSDGRFIVAGEGNLFIQQEALSEWKVSPKELAHTINQNERILLSDAYPNPFNPTTTIQFGITRAEFVELTVYDIQGRIVTTLINSFLAAGSHQATFDASRISSGVYYYQIRAGGFVDTKKMVVLK